MLQKIQLRANANLELENYAAENSSTKTFKLQLTLKAR